jgi:hypothetical protein
MFTQGESYRVTANQKVDQTWKKNNRNIGYLRRKENEEKNMDDK